MLSTTGLLIFLALVALFLAGCSVPNQQQAVVKGIETVLTARVEPMDLYV
tara:strand:- start:186 stop:335 length:150 start_codon:yes stop_codon:yes gene_type:complete